MALIGNYASNNRTINRPFYNTTSGSVVYGTPGTITPVGALKNRHLGGIPLISATPNGYVHPGAWVMPRIGGGMSSYRQLDMSIQETLASLYAGVNIDSNISGSIGITQAQLDQIANLTAALSASINITDGQLAAISALEASITASMAITDAQLGAIIDLMASLSGSFNLTNAANFATADISADMSVTTGTATPQQIAAEVWDTVLADHQVIGSTGKALNDAGSAGNPWSADLASNNSVGTFGYLVQKLLTVAKFLGLK